jgi:hydroxypyruvate reductase
MKPDLISVAPLLAKQMAQLEQDFTIHKLPPPAERGPFLAKLQSCRFMQTTGFHGADAALINALPKLEIIACMGVGVDAIDLAATRARKIAVTNTPDVLNDDVADLAIALMLMTARRLGLSERWVRDGRWTKQGAQPLASKVTGKRLGILGLGRIGKAIARRAAGFDMMIGYHGRQRQPEAPYKYYSDLTAMAADVDFLVVICPGGPATRNIVNRAVIEALGPKGILINVARGSVVDEPALVEALKSGKLGGAGLDVFADEPNVPEALLTMDQVVLAPHVGSATTETRNAMADLVVANLRAHLRGEKLVTPYS